MFPLPMSQPASNFDQYQETAMNVAGNVATIICMPVLMVLRPEFGSEYFSPVLSLFTTALMIVLAAFAQIGTGITRLIPAMAFHGPAGLYGIATLAKLYFALAFLHSVRTWRLMIRMHLEENSFFIGPPLFVFQPFPLPWWIVRIVVEPVFVFLLALTLRNLFILQDSAADYLMIAAVALAVKAYFEWFIRVASHPAHHECSEPRSDARKNPRQHRHKRRSGQGQYGQPPQRPAPGNGRPHALGVKP